MSKTTEHYDRVKTFMLKAGQEVHDEPTIPNEKTRYLRAKLTLEEAFEAVEAMGFGVFFGQTNLVHQVENFELQPMGEVSLPEVAKELADISVINRGNFISFGLPDEYFLAEVDKNNLDKFGPGHYFREDGKLVKPPGFQKPDLAKMIEDLSEQRND